MNTIELKTNTPIIGNHQLIITDECDNETTHNLSDYELEQLITQVSNLTNNPKTKINL